MSPFSFIMASSFFQTRNVTEWLEDDGPASRAHARPADAPDKDRDPPEQPERAMIAAQ